ncbi:hypothetical protein [Streptomyces sp. NBC_01518]|uniref:hypothetical protein n=1 Tax=Streptomyces sp. NBC_01518 TaxID=2903891 RepID=UPI003865743F
MPAPSEYDDLHTGSLALIRQPGDTRIEDHLAKAREQVTVSVAPGAHGIAQVVQAVSS